MKSKHTHREIYSRISYLHNSNTGIRNSFREINNQNFGDVFFKKQAQFQRYYFIDFLLLLYFYPNYSNANDHPVQHSTDAVNSFSKFQPFSLPRPQAGYLMVWWSHPVAINELTRNILRYPLKWEDK